MEEDLQFKLNHDIYARCEILFILQTLLPESVVEDGVQQIITNFTSLKQRLLIKIVDIELYRPTIREKYNFYLMYFQQQFPMDNSNLLEYQKAWNILQNKTIASIPNAVPPDNALRKKTNNPTDYSLLTSVTQNQIILPSSVNVTQINDIITTASSDRIYITCLFWSAWNHYLNTNIRNPGNVRENTYDKVSRLVYSIFDPYFLNWPKPVVVKQTQWTSDTYLKFADDMIWYFTTWKLLENNIIRQYGRKDTPFDISLDFGDVYNVFDSFLRRKDGEDVAGWMLVAVLRYAIVALIQEDEELQNNVQNLVDDYITRFTGLINHQRYVRVDGNTLDWYNSYVATRLVYCASTLEDRNFAEIIENINVEESE